MTATLVAWLSLTFSVAEARIDDGEEVRGIMRWTGYRGRYLLHCHNVEREDHEMVARIDVI